MARQNATTVDVRQVDAAFHATINPPAFRFGDRWGEFQGAMFRRLSPFGMRLHDIKVENPTANPADFSVACWLLGFAAAARFRFDRVEVWTNRLPLLLDLGKATQIVTAALGVATDLEVGQSIVTKGVVIGLHVQPPANFVDLLLRRLVPVPPAGEPPLKTSGLAFASETAEPRASVVVEPSNQVPEGLFMRFVIDYHSVADEATIISEVSTFIEDFTHRIGIDLRWPEQ